MFRGDEFPSGPQPEVQFFERLVFHIADQQPGAIDLDVFRYLLQFIHIHLSDLI